MVMMLSFLLNIIVWNCTVHTFTHMGSHMVCALKAERARICACSVIS